MHELESQHSVIEARASDLYVIGKRELPLEPACRNALVEILLLFRIGLLARNHEQIRLGRNAQLIRPEACNGKADAIRILAGLLDVVRRITFGRTRCRTATPA